MVGMIGARLVQSPGEVVITGLSGGPFFIHWITRDPVSHTRIPRLFSCESLRGV
jgi:hypothetical protein